METTSRRAEYTRVGRFRRLVRDTAATRPVTWLSVGIRQPLDERDHCFERAVGMHPGLAIHRTRAANRRIPVMRLDPA